MAWSVPDVLMSQVEGNTLSPPGRLQMLETSCWIEARMFTPN